MALRVEQAEVHDTLADPVTSGVREIGPERRLGQRIGDRYRLLKMLGYGAGGAVYEACDERKNEPVAVKVLHEHLRGSNAHVARFLREARTARAVPHSAVVRVIDA